MYTIKVANDSVKVWYNDNGPSISTEVTFKEMVKLNAACDGQFDPETCVELNAVFTAQSDYELVPFTIINESDLSFGWLDAIAAVACYYLPSMLEDAA